MLTITSDGRPFGTKVTTESGEEITGITSVQLNMYPNDLPRASIDAYIGRANVKAFGQINFTMEDGSPVTAQALRDLADRIDSEQSNPSEETP